jgi:uncharacterized protein YdiU (UPF0061 family)
MYFTAFYFMFRVHYLPHLWSRNCMLIATRMQLGLRKEEAQDKGLIDELTSALSDTSADYTNVMRTATLA